MMNNYDTDDTFLGRWISGELSDEERIAFEKTEAFKQFNSINTESQLIEGPSIDTEAALIKVKAKNQTKHRNTKVIRLWYSRAAAILLLVSSIVFLNSSKTHTTGIGEKQLVTLTDGSTVHLNSNSSISLKRFFWQNNRKIELKGEAFFKVTNGSGFNVHTSKGIVSVLGTQFNIHDRLDFRLQCYEGKVRFTQSDIVESPYILTQGKSISIMADKIEEKTFKGNQPLWKNEVSSFENQPLSLVLEALSNHFPIQFDATSVDVNRLYTGSFKHDNLETALKATLIPMGITYEKDTNNTNIIILSE